MRTAIVSTAMFLSTAFAAPAQSDKTSGVKGKAHGLLPKADPDATRLLTEARANRALWKNFPGFAADIEVNLDGKISKGKVAIDARGGIVLRDLHDAAERWAREVLATDIDHRLNAETEPTACVFTDDDTSHPLGRSVRLLGDGMGSVYRVRDRQIVVVNRRMGKMRFSITVLQTASNKDGKYLPSSFVVHYWDVATGDLRKTDAFTHAWKRVGDFDLPAYTRVVSTSRDVSVKSLTLSNHAMIGKEGAGSGR